MMGMRTTGMGVSALLVGQLVLAVGAEAQEITWGARGGLSAGYTLFETESFSHRDVRPGPVVGLTAALPVSGPLSLQMELRYVEKGWLDSYRVGGHKQGYLEVPLLLRLQGSGRLLPHLLLGASAAYEVVCSQGDIPGSGNVGCDDPRVTLGRAAFDYGVEGGGGVGWPVAGGVLSLDLMLNLGLRDVISEPIPRGFQSHITMMLSAAYTLGGVGSRGGDR